MCNAIDKTSHTHPLMNLLLLGVTQHHIYIITMIGKCDFIKIIYAQKTIIMMLFHQGWSPPHFGLVIVFDKAILVFGGISFGLSLVLLKKTKGIPTFLRAIRIPHLLYGGLG